MPNFFAKFVTLYRAKKVIYINIFLPVSTMEMSWKSYYLAKKCQKMPQPSHDYRCVNCDRNFTTNSGLWKHKKVCINAVSANANENKEEIAKLTTLITQLMTQNTELIKKIGTTNNITYQQHHQQYHQYQQH